ncbi:MAG TPA: nitrous oxide reductase accessory protein NosL [Blastocatellia bacterium]|nr:nitrous oxide reductase accessory protein NosL [Blastocatellia bacterium]
MVLVLASAVACSNKRGGPVSADATEGVCPVCRMSVKASDKWAAVMIFKDGTKLMFESPGDMLSFYTSPSGYDVPDTHKDPANIERILVKDYLTGNQMDINQASLAYKSKIRSPMGPDLIPFASRDDALLFIQENGGSLISFTEITPEMIRNLRKG